MLRAPFGKLVELALATTLKGKRASLPKAHAPEVHQSA